jgi:hypothetical protein
MQRKDWRVADTAVGFMLMLPGPVPGGFGAE